MTTSINRREMGWIKLSRKLLDNPLFKSKPHSWLTIWITVLLNANWRESVFFDGVSEVVVPAGSWVTSAEKLATNTRTTRQTIRSALKYLEATKSITIQTTKRWTMITVTNWSSYQTTLSHDKPTEEPSAKPSSGARTTNEVTSGTTNRTTTSEEVKNIRNKTMSKSDDLDAPSPAPFAHQQSKRKSRANKFDPEFDPWFENEFWPLYPRKEGKKPAKEAASMKATTPEKRSQIMARLRDLLPEYGRRKAESGQRMIPMGATWFNQERWEDEIDVSHVRPEHYQESEGDGWEEYVPPEDRLAAER